MYSTVIAAIAKMFGHLFDWQKAKAEHLLEADVLDDKKDYKKATDIAEKIIKIAECYEAKMNPLQRWNFRHLCNQFRKYK